MNKAQRDHIKNIWVVTREYGTLAGAGGVKDVAKQLAEALAHSGRNVSVVLPLYGFMDPNSSGFSPLALSFDVDMFYVHEERREPIKVWHKKESVDLYLIDSPRFAEKRGIYTYTAEEESKSAGSHQGDGHLDYFAMNVLHQKAAICLMISLGQKPDIIHCHDAHAALLPAMIHENEGFRQYFKKTGCVVSIHNAGTGYHQEVEDLAFAKAVSGLPYRVIARNTLNKKFDPLLAASDYAVLNTVSENYARELRETDDDEMTGWLGHILMGRGVRLNGVTNGITPTAFNLKNYKALGLATGFTPGTPRNSETITDKSLCKQDLCRLVSGEALKTVQKTGGLSWQQEQPLFTFIGRLTAQKGVNIMVDALQKLLGQDPDFQIVILGSGQKEIEQSLIQLATNEAYCGRVCLLQGYDPILANKIYAAGDFIIIPSQYEPCGLTDFIAQLFGNLPIVHHIGGLVKVVDQETGFAYQQHSGEALGQTMERAMRIFRHSPPAIAQMQRAAITLINQKYTWGKVMHSYLDLYRRALLDS